MTSQHRHPHLQQSQQSSQYYELSQSQNTNSLPPRQSSPAIYMQHHPTSSASPYSSSSLQQSYAAHSSATLVNPYQSGLLHNTLIPTARPGSSAVVRYPTTAQAGSPPPTYLPAASTSTASAPSSQAQIGVSSRIVNSLQSLVSLLEKQNAKLDKHDERLKRLNEGFDQLKTETTRCTEGIEAFSKTMSKKLKTMTDTASKTLQEDIACSLEKDLSKLRKETADLGKISKKLASDDSSAKLAAVATAQTEILQALSSSHETATEQADSIVDRISDHQLDLLHRLSDQFRLVTASISTSANATRQTIEQSAGRQDEAHQQQIRQFLTMLEALAARPLTTTMATQTITEVEFALPTPPTSQRVRALQKPVAMNELATSAASYGFHRCAAVECTSCIIQGTVLPNEENAEEGLVISRQANDELSTSPNDEVSNSQIQIFESSSTETQVSIAPIASKTRSTTETSARDEVTQSHDQTKQSKSPARSASSHQRRPLKALRPFIMKKRRILQSDEEDVREEDAEHESIDEGAILRYSELSSKLPTQQQPPYSAFALKRVQAWRMGAAALQEPVSSSEIALATGQTQSAEQEKRTDVPATSTASVAPEPQFDVTKSANRAVKNKRTKATSPNKRRKIS